MSDFTLSNLTLEADNEDIDNELIMNIVKNCLHGLFC